ncbi:MAG: glycosyltransferase family 4 protein [Planctomycetes bacterium]|nr:glycosyltransferase family 4 protein [Planctomycetota bacterium]
MRFGIQALSLRPGQVGGQGVFIRRLLQHMLPQLGGDELVLFMRPELATEQVCQRIGAHAAVEAVVETPDEHYGDGYAAWNVRLLEQAALDVVFFPLSFFFPRPLPLPVLLHVPDIQHEYFPEYFPPEQLAWRRERIPESLAWADAVITYTHFSASGLREKYGAEPSKLNVVPAGGFLDHELAEAAEERPAPAAGAPFIFYPAADWPHKNHETLLRALARMAEQGRAEHLVLTGMLSQRGDVLRALIAQLGLTERVHFLGCVSQNELIRLYRTARALAFPSRFEGFGLPLVEAMQLGCPVIASRAEGVLETAGDAALFCDDDPAAWAATLTDVLADEARLGELRERGYRRAADFDWSRCAAAHLALLRKLGAE